MCPEYWAGPASLRRLPQQRSLGACRVAGLVRARTSVRGSLAAASHLWRVAIPAVAGPPSPLGSPISHTGQHLPGRRRFYRCSYQKAAPRLLRRRGSNSVTGPRHGHLPNYARQPGRDSSTPGTVETSEPGVASAQQPRRSCRSSYSGSSRSIVLYRTRVIPTATPLVRHAFLPVAGHVSSDRGTARRLAP